MNYGMNEYDNGYARRSTMKDLFTVFVAAAVLYSQNPILNYDLKAPKFIAKDAIMPSKLELTVERIEEKLPPFKN